MRREIRPVRCGARSTGPKDRMARQLTQPAARPAREELVIAAGAWSHLLARQFGDRIPLETERGYNTTLPIGAFDVKRQLIFSRPWLRHHAACDGPAVGGAVELGGLEAPAQLRALEGAAAEGAETSCRASPRPRARMDGLSSLAARLASGDSWFFFSQARHLAGVAKNTGDFTSMGPFPNKNGRMTWSPSRSCVARRKSEPRADGLRLRVQIECVLAHLASPARLLVSAERQGCVEDVVAVDPHRTGASCSAIDEPC